MLPMRCRPGLCSDSRHEDELHCLHGGSWECVKHDTAEKSFCRRLQYLPPEMRLHILSFCPFHVLSNPALWLRDECPSRLPRLMRTDPHFARRQSEDALDVLSFTMDHVRVNVTCDFDVFAAKEHLYRPGPADEEAWREHRDVFGTTNRYNCFSYRSCEHHDTSRPPAVDEVDGFECWRRMAGANGVAVDETTFLRLVKPSPALALDIHPFDLVFTMPQRGSHTMLPPGVYYLEFVDYAWEKMVAAVDSRPEHFLLDPARANDGPFRRGRIPMSVIFRRVCHPAEEVGDAFRLVKSFENTDGRLSRIAHKHVFINFLRTGKMRRSKMRRAAVGEDGGAEAGTSSGTEPRGSESDSYYLRVETARWFDIQAQMVYKHALSPMLGVTVRRWTPKPDTDEPNGFGFSVNFESYVRLVNVEENDNGFRINFFVRTADVPWRDRVVYGAALANLANVPEKRFYAFAKPSWSSDLRDGLEESTRARLQTYESVFETLFCK